MSEKPVVTGIDGAVLQEMMAAMEVLHARLRILEIAAENHGWELSGE